MRLSARLGVAASIIAVAFATACGSDSTGPSASDQPSRVAQHFDSIYVQAHNASNGGNNAFELRAELATLLEVNAAFGAAPAHFTVHTADGDEKWRGYEFLERMPNGDSTYVLLVYRDADAHTIAVVYFEASGEIQQAAFVTNDTLAIMPSGGSGSTSMTSSGAACGTISSALLNPTLGDVSIASCNLATFSTTLSLQMPATTGVDAALTSISFSHASVNGIFVVDADANRRVNYLLHMMKQGSHRL